MRYAFFHKRHVNKKFGRNSFCYSGCTECSLYNDVVVGAIASRITSLTIVISTVYLDTDQRKHQSSASLAFVRGIYPKPVNSPHKWPVTRKMFPFDDIIIEMAHDFTTKSTRKPKLHNFACDQRRWVYHDPVLLVNPFRSLEPLLLTLFLLWLGHGKLITSQHYRCCNYIPMHDINGG